VRGSSFGWQRRKTCGIGSLTKPARRSEMLAIFSKGELPSKGKLTHFVCAIKSVVELWICGHNDVELAALGIGQARRATIKFHSHHLRQLKPQGPTSVLSSLPHHNVADDIIRFIVLFPNTIPPLPTPKHSCWENTTFQPLQAVACVL
jgi:hypothetical protein